MEKIFLKSLNIRNRGIYTLKLCQLFILSTMFVSISYAQTNVIDGHEYVASKRHPVGNLQHRR